MPGVPRLARSSQYTTYGTDRSTGLGFAVGVGCFDFALGTTTSTGLVSVGFVSAAFTSAAFTSAAFTSAAFTSAAFTSAGFTSTAFESSGLAARSPWTGVASGSTTVLGSEELPCGSPGLD